MQSVDREISISITKIFNWHPSKSKSSFQLEFFSQKTAALIIKKSVKGEYHSNAMNLNSPLKITYTDDESVITMNLIHKISETTQLLGQFEIDLNSLAKKNIQYFPFGHDNVLQINLFSPKARITESRQILPREQDNQHFIRQKQTFLERKSLKADPRVKKSFSEKVLNLLKEVQQIKGHKKQQRYPQENHYQEQNMGQNTLTKTLSERKFRPYTLRSQDEGKQKSNRGQRHKLMLQTLNVVPCNQYYTKQVSHKQTRESRGNYAPNTQSSYQGRYHKVYNGY